jgi:hypothetical protein
MTDLGTLGDSNCYAMGINDAGQAVGYVEREAVIRHGPDRYATSHGADGNGHGRLLFAMRQHRQNRRQWKLDRNAGSSFSLLIQAPEVCAQLADHAKPQMLFMPMQPCPAQPSLALREIGCVYQTM